MTWWVKDRQYFYDNYYNTTRWKKLRLIVLAEEPLCRMCEAENIITPAAIIDHIIPLEQDESLAYVRSNLQPLCLRCSGIKTAADQEKKKLFERRKNR